MSEMVDRLTRVVVEKIGVPDDALARAIVRCVLTEMRESTGLMKDAGAETYGIGNAAIGLPVTVLDGQPSKAWRAMIDEALR